MTFRLFLMILLTVGIAKAQSVKNAMADAGCDCSIYPLRPASCVKVCGKTTGRVVNMTSDKITLETKIGDNQLIQKTYALKPSLKNKLKVEPGTDVTVTYNKSDQIARSVTVQ